MNLAAGSSPHATPGGTEQPTAPRWVWAFLDRPRAALGAAADFWCAVTDATLSARRGEQGQWATLLPRVGSAHLKLQGVDECRGGHLDLAVPDVDAAVAHAVSVGATVTARHDGWTVLTSPAGLPWCLVPWHGERDPAPPAATPGGRIRVDQVALDVGPAAYERELAFWAALTGWRVVASVRPEFTLLVPPPGLPIRLLLQRLDTQAPAAVHVDLACADVEAAAAYHRSLGAQVVAEQPFWTVLRDPAGQLYCLTGRDPETGRLPAR